MDAYIYDATRTPRGRGRETGALHEVKPVDLLAALYRALEERTGLDPAVVDDVVLGCNTQVGDQGADIAKISTLHAGWSESISGATVSRFCASGLDAVNIAATKIHAGMADIMVAGGVESMSRVPMLADRGAWFTDPEVATSTRFVHMGVAADLVATLSGLSREELDTYALRSHQRAARARDEGRFDGSVIPVQTPGGQVRHDEAIRDGLTIEKLGSLAPAFVDFGLAGQDALCLERYPELDAVEHLHTVGTSPAVVDAASALLIGSRAAGRTLGLRPRARIVAMADASVEPVVMLTAPAPATRAALEKGGMKLSDVDVFEVNESFAAVPMTYQRELDIDPEIMCPNGGAIAMGHPLGATGGVLVSMALDELERRDATVATIAIPAGAGIGAATVIERI